MRHLPHPQPVLLTPGLLQRIWEVYGLYALSRCRAEGIARWQEQVPGVGAHPKEA